MRPGNGYIYVETALPPGGIVTSVPINRLNPRYTPHCLNVTFEDGRIRMRDGSRQVGQRLVGVVKGFVEFKERLVVFTDLRQYVYDETTARFIDITKGRTDLPITGMTSNTVTVGGDHTAYFTPGRLFSIEGSVSHDDVYRTVSSVFSGGSTTITFEGSVQDPVAAGNVVKAEDFDGGRPIDFAVLNDLGQSRLVVTNGFNRPRVWYGDPNNPMVDWNPTFPDFITCRTFAVFAEHLFLGGIVAGSDEHQTVAWSDAGRFDDFVSGTSGTQKLYQLLSDIVTMRVLGDRLVIYSSDAIVTGIFVGLPAVFAFEVVIPEGTRLVGPGAVMPINVGHIYVSEDNIYLFDGSRGLRVLGDNIHADYKYVKDHNRIHLVASLNDYSKRTLFISVPSVLGGTVTYTALYDVFNLGNIIWSKHVYHDEVTAWGFYRSRSPILTWEDAPWEQPNSPWSEEVGPWLDESEEPTFPARVYGTSDGRVMVSSPNIFTDRGRRITMEYSTPSFEVPEASLSLKGRWVEVEIGGSGGLVNVHVEVLGGSLAPVPVELSSNIRTHRVPIDVVSPTCRVIISSTDPIELYWIRVWVKSGGMP